MVVQKIHGKIALMVVLFIVSAFILGMKLLNPTPIQIIVGDNEATVTQIPGFFTDVDVAIIAITSVFLGASGAYLMLPSSAKRPAERSSMDERKEKWGKIQKTLKDDEQKIYRVILDSDGVINQSELVEKTGLSKAKISRCLDLLESRGLVERKRRGMGNVVLLKF